MRKWFKLGSKEAKFLPAGLEKFAGENVALSGNRVYQIQPDGSLKRRDKIRKRRRKAAITGRRRHPTQPM